MVTRRRSTTMIRGPRRQTSWDDQLFNFDTASGSRVDFLLVQNVSDTESRGLTLARMILGFTFLPSVPGVASGSQAISIGVALASDDAFAAGALPEPQVESDFPVGGWLYRSQYIVVDETLATGFPLPVRIDVDLSVQRKLDRASLYCTMINDPIEGTAFNVRMIGLIRSLYRLP